MLAVVKSKLDGVVKSAVGFADLSQDARHRQQRSLAHAQTGGCGARGGAFGPIGRAACTHQRNQSFIVGAANGVCTGHDAQGLRGPGLSLRARRAGGTLRILCAGRTRWALRTLCAGWARRALWTLCAARTRWALLTLFAARTRWALWTRRGLTASRDSERHDEDRNAHQSHRQTLWRRRQFAAAI